MPTLREYLESEKGRAVVGLVVRATKVGKVFENDGRDGPYRSQSVTVQDASGTGELRLTDPPFPIQNGQMLAISAVEGSKGLRGAFVSEWTGKDNKTRREIKVYPECIAPADAAGAATAAYAPPPPAPLPAGAPAPAPAAPAYVPPARLTRKRAAELAIMTVEDAARMAGFAPDLTKLPPEVFQALTAVANTILIGVQRGDIGLEEGE